MKRALSLCPLCGGTPKVNVLSRYDNKHWIMCDGPKHRITFFGSTQGVVTRRWNEFCRFVDAGKHLFVGMW